MMELARRATCNSDVPGSPSIRLRRLHRRLLDRSARAFALRCLGAITTFGFGMALARVMKLDDYGTFVSLLNAAIIVALIIAGGQQVRVLGMAEPAERARALSEGFGVSAAYMVVLALAGAVALGLLARTETSPFPLAALLAAVIVVPPLALVEIQGFFARAVGAIGAALLPRDVLWRFLISLFALGWWVTMGRPVGATVLLVVASVSLTVLLLLQRWQLRTQSAPGLSRAPDRRPDRAALGRAAREAWPFWVTSVVNPLFVTSDVVIVSLIEGPAAAAPYFAANRIALTLDFFVTAFAFVAGPEIARLYRQGRIAEISRLVSFVAVLSFSLAAFTTFTLLFAGPFVLALFGAEFVAAQGILIVLATGQALSAFLGVGLLALDMTGHGGAAMRIMAFAAPVGLFAMGLATVLFGPLGTAFASVLSVLAMKGTMAFHLARSEGIDMTAAAAIAHGARRLATMRGDRDR